MKKSRMSPVKSQPVIKVVISNGEYLSDKFDFLPSGIIDKTYTGIGGTSLELDCERDSIVVVPYNNIANSKESKKSVTRGYSVHKYKRNKQNQLKSSLSKYVENARKNGQPIKLVCVNDQLLHLRQELSDLNFDFKNFFLLFDEIDSMQEQSAFRSVMDQCMDVYLEHPKEKRAMITATLRKFTHPDLKNEPVHKVICTDRPIEKLDVVISERASDELYMRIKSIVDVDDSKIVVACNHIKTALDLCTTIQKEYTSVSLGILCSPGSRKAVGEFYQKLDINGKLPTQINFITAAYFNGCDITEKYHSIVLSSIRIASLQLSPSTIIQIVGRGRQGLLTSQLVIQKDVRRDNYKNYTLEQLIALGNHTANINDGLRLMTKDLGDIGVDLMRVIHGALVEGLKDFPSVFRKIDDSKSAVSYFKIDQRLIEQETSSLLEDLEEYIDVLQESFDININPPIYKGQSIDVVGVDKANKLREILEELKDNLESSSFEITKNELLKFKAQYNALKYAELDYAIKIMLLGVDKKWDIKILFNQIENSLSQKSLLAVLKKIYCQVLWCSFAGDKTLISILEKGIKIDSAYTIHDFKEAQNNLVDRVDNHKKLLPTKYSDFKMLLKDSPSFIKTVIFQCIETRRSISGKTTRLVTLKKLTSQEFPFS